MKERIVNIFVYVDRESIRTIGYTEYEMEGTYEELTSYLQSRVETDHAVAAWIELGREYFLTAFRFALRVGTLPHLIPVMSQIVGDSLYSVTQIIDGSPGINESMHDPEHTLVPDYL